MRSPPRLWKTVPALYDKIDVENVAAFKAKLKTFLFSKYFHQPLFLTLFFEVFNQLCYIQNCLLYHCQLGLEISLFIYSYSCKAH